MVGRNSVPNYQDCEIKAIQDRCVSFIKHHNRSAINQTFKIARTGAIEVESTRAAPINGIS